MNQPADVRPLETLQPLELLFETPGLADFGLPLELAELYGGSLGFLEPRLYANFVASVDGVVAIPTETESSQMIAAGSKRDRFVMGLLRACADAVLIGAGTLHHRRGDSGRPNTHTRQPRPCTPSCVACETGLQGRRWRSSAAAAGSTRTIPGSPSVRWC